MPELPGHARFRQAFAKREVVNLFETHITLISLDDLIANKQATAREKDINDIDELRKRHGK